MQGTNTGHEDAEGMASVGVRLTAELGHTFMLANKALPPRLATTFANRCAVVACR